MLDELREQAVQRHHKMTSVLRNGTTMLTRCTVCHASIYSLDGIIGGIATTIDCTATHEYATIPHYEPKLPDLGYSIGPDNTQCPDCGRGSTIVGTSCYSCGFRPSRPYTPHGIIPPSTILYYETYDTIQYNVTEHVSFVDEFKVRYCTQHATRATVRSPHGTQYQFVRTDKKRYTGPCGTENVLRHVYINDDDDDNPKFLYRYGCACKCIRTR